MDLAGRMPAGRFILPQATRDAILPIAWLRPHFADDEGRLRMSANDAQRLGVSPGGHVRLSTARGSVEVPVDVTDTMRAGHLSLPNGLGLAVAGPDGIDPVATGIAPNDLTESAHRDEWVGTPWHKHVPATVEVVASPA